MNKRPWNGLYAEHYLVLTSSRAVLNASSPNTPLLHHSNTPCQKHVTAEPSFSDLACEDQDLKPN